MHNNMDFAAHMEAVALDLLGQPSSKHGNEWRYGRNGSLSIDIKKGTYFNHETNEGGGVVELIRCKKPDTDVIDYLRAHGTSGLMAMVPRRLTFPTTQPAIHSRV